MSNQAEQFSYHEGRLCCEGQDLTALANDLGTPFFCYSSQAIEDRYLELERALQGMPAQIYYAIKANGNQAVIATLARLGAGADVVSQGEMMRALAAGVPADKIVFAGVGKTAAEMAAALDAGILQFNVESLPEIERLDAVARQKGQKARIALRVNPDVDAQTHKSISTGKAENKFGIEMDQARDIARRIGDYPGLQLSALAVHIGSQITNLDPYRETFRRLVALYKEMRAEGVPLTSLDLGGGVGISYNDETPPDFAQYAAMAREATEGLDAELAFEPGRSLVGNAGVLVTRVVYVKEAPGRRFIIIDAAMNDLIRPMLYEAWHNIRPLIQPAADAVYEAADVVGPICESTDTFARDRELPPLREGDLLAIMSAGAYGAVMSSVYNGRPLAPEVLVRGSEAAVVRARPSYQEMIAQDLLPPWLDVAAAQPLRGQ